jgi:hypothetical protein
MKLRRSVLAAFVLAFLALTPGVAQAQYPYDWHAATPPSWFTESVDSSCHIREEATSHSWSLFYTSDPNPFVCIKPLPVTPELGPGISLKCAGLVQHNQYDDHPDIYGAIWECYVTSGDFREARCQRISWYEERPLGDPNEAFNMDSGGWYDPDTFEPYDCRPSGSEDDDADDAACQQAKQKLKKARRRLERADGRKEVGRAKKQLKKAKERKAEACG